MPTDMRLLSLADQLGAATCLKSSAPRPDYRLLCLDANGGRYRGQQPALTKSVRAYFTSTNRRVCASSSSAARMRLCGRAKDKRRCRKVACLAPRLLPPGVGDFHWSPCLAAIVRGVDRDCFPDTGRKTERRACTMTDEPPIPAGFVSEPGPFESIETWEHWLAEVQAWPDDNGMKA
jgi:hypothetical protein